MPKPKKTKSPAAGRDRPLDPERARRIRRYVLQFSAYLAVMGAAVVGFHYLTHFVEDRAAFRTDPPRVVLMNRPAWMSDRVADQILSTAKPPTAHSVFDQRLLIDVADMLRSNPWVKQVKQVRRAYQDAPGDTLEVDCEYRAPIALIHWKDFYWLIDGEGTALPEQYTPDQLPKIMYGSDGQMNIRIIEGVSHDPPGTGQHWGGEDLAAGLDLVKLLYGKPCAQEVCKVDVTNFGGRVDAREAQLVLRTVHQTEVRWGRPINAKDFFVEISPAEKLDHMEQLVERYHRIDANHSWVDIRFDRVTSPKQEEADVGH